MREDQQRRTTIAAEALLGPVKLGIRRALLPMIVAETPFILRIQVRLEFERERERENEEHADGTETGAHCRNPQ